MAEADETATIAPIEASAPPKGLLPWRKVIPIYIALWCEAFNSSSIFAYVGYMVLDFGMSKDEHDPSYMYYAGILGSCFFAAQLLSSFFWGTLSDRVGRRPILLVGQCGSMCASVLFGLATQYPFAVAARSLSGLLNGTVGVSKTYLGEICDSSNVARAFSYIGLMWGFGSVAGSVFGGLLARPAKQYPKYFSETGLFGRHPYLIPNMVAAVVTCTGFILCFMYLTENKRKSHAPPTKELVMREQLGLTEAPEQARATDESSSSSQDEESGYTSTSGIDGNPDPNDAIEMIPLDETPISTPIPTPVGTPRPSLRTRSLNLDYYGPGVALDHEEGPAYIDGYGGLSPLYDRSLPWYRRGCAAKVTQLPSYIKSLPVFKEWTPVMCCALYAIYGSFNTMADEVWPLWALTPVSEGGLAFTTDLIGICNAWAGAVNLMFNLILYPILVKRYGFVKVFRIGIIANILVYPIYPLFKFVPLPVAGETFTFIRFWFLLGLLIMCRFCASQAGFSSVMTLISNSVYPETMGSTNGLGQSMVAFSRMLAPFTAATLLALCIGPNFIWPFNYGRLAWWSISIFAIITLVLSLNLPLSLNKPRIEAEADKLVALESSRLTSVSSDSDLVDTNTTLSEASRLSYDDDTSSEPRKSDSSSDSSAEHVHLDI